MPQAIVAFLDGEDFEDCIRNAISIGGDSDTIGCITGSIAEAFFGIPQNIRDEGISYLSPKLKQIVLDFEAKYPCVIETKKKMKGFFPRWFRTLFCHDVSNNFLRTGGEQEGAVTRMVNGK